MLSIVDENQKKFLFDRVNLDLNDFNGLTLLDFYKYDLPSFSDIEKYFIDGKEINLKNSNNKLLPALESFPPSTFLNMTTLGSSIRKVYPVNSIRRRKYKIKAKNSENKELFFFRMIVAHKHMIENFSIKVTFLKDKDLEIKRDITVEDIYEMEKNGILIRKEEEFKFTSYESKYGRVEAVKKYTSKIFSDDGKLIEYYDSPIVVEFIDSSKKVKNLFSDIQLIKGEYNFDLVYINSRKIPYYILFNNGEIFSGYKADKSFKIPTTEHKAFYKVLFDNAKLKLNEFMLESVIFNRSTKEELEIVLNIVKSPNDLKINQLKNMIGGK